MLTRQQSCRHNQRHLRSRHCHGKRRAQRHFGFAKPHIAANQPIHWFARTQILNHVFYGVQLVIGFAIWKLSAKFIIRSPRRNKHIGGFQVSFSGYFNQFFGYIFDFCFYFGFFSLPSRPAQHVKLHVFII